MIRKRRLTHSTQLVVVTVIPEDTGIQLKSEMRREGTISGYGGVGTAWTSTWGWQQRVKSGGTVEDRACWQADFR